MSSVMKSKELGPISKLDRCIFNMVWTIMVTTKFEYNGSFEMDLEHG